MKHERLEGLITVQDFHTYMKLRDKNTNLAEQMLLKQVQGQTKAARAIVYRMGLKTCLRGAIQGRI